MILDVYKVTLNSPTTPYRHHYGLFIQAEGHREHGYLIHVLGDGQSGYKLDIYGDDSDTGIIVEEIVGFLGKVLIGYAQDSKLVDFMDLCEAVPPPGVQMNEKGVKLDKSTPWIRDAEWVEELIQRLKAEALIIML